jgi:hypothetical protein
MRPSENAAETAEQFYNAALEVLLATGQPFLVGGGYVMREYADVNRETKDLDVFCRPSDSLRLLGALKSAGYETMVEDPDWIAKAFQADFRVDLIFGAANRLHRVDDTWFTNAPTIELHGHQVKLVSAEDTIWSKAYVQERDRFDGADINHIIRKSGPKLDWRRLLDRFDAHWEILFGLVLSFRFVYPSERDKVPEWLLRELIGRLEQQLASPLPHDPICRGPVLAWNQYRIDTLEWNYRT